MLTDINELWIGYLLLSEQFHYIQHFILFQYISCYSLSIKTMVSVGIRKVSIHLMLLFIGLLQSNSEPHSPFQYISCYSLSVTGNTYGAKDVRFNTSHVTLYHAVHRTTTGKVLFQYISCYSLSQVTVGLVEHLFCFNTSHVTLYH